MFQPLEFFLEGNPLRGVAQNHLGDDLRFRETQQVVSQVLVPIEKRRFFDELQFGIRILPKDNFAQRERIQSPPERGFLLLAALDDERNDAALFRQDFNDKARVAVRKAMQNNGTSLDHYLAGNGGQPIACPPTTCRWMWNTV